VVKNHSFKYRPFRRRHAGRRFALEDHIVCRSLQRGSFDRAIATVLSFCPSGTGCTLSNSRFTPRRFRISKCVLHRANGGKWRGVTVFFNRTLPLYLKVGWTTWHLPAVCAFPVPSTLRLSRDEVMTACTCYFEIYVGDKYRFNCSCMHYADRSLCCRGN